MIPEHVFHKFPVMFTERLRLREVRMNDAKDIYSFKSDPLVTAPYCSEPYKDENQAIDWIKILLEGYKQKQHVMWMIALKEDDRVIGDCSLWHLDILSECGELGYELHHDYWKRGLASEAVDAIINYGFTTMNLNRIEADPFEKNDSSSELLEKFGFKREGNLRERRFFRGEFFDQLYYGLLKKDWISQGTGI